MTGCAAECYVALIGQVFVVRRGELRGEVGRVLALDDDDPAYCHVEFTGIGVRVVECAWIEELMNA